MSSKVLLPLILAAVCGVGGAGCSMGTPTAAMVAPDEPLGAVTLRWSVAGSVDPRACRSEAADRIDISVVTSEGGGELEAFQEPCESFERRMVLAAGEYAVRARLVDARRRELTTDEAVPSFTVAGGQEVAIVVDFPATAFLGATAPTSLASAR